MTLLMIGSFFGWLFLARQTGMVVLVLFVQVCHMEHAHVAASSVSRAALAPSFSSQAFIYKELTSLAMKDSKERYCRRATPPMHQQLSLPLCNCACSQLPGFSFFYVYWFVVTVFFIYGRTLMPHLQVWMRASRFPSLRHVCVAIDSVFLVYRCWTLALCNLSLSITLPSHTGCTS